MTSSMSKEDFREPAMTFSFDLNALTTLLDNKTQEWREQHVLLTEHSAAILQQLDSLGAAVADAQARVRAHAHQERYFELVNNVLMCTHDEREALAVRAFALHVLFRLAVVTKVPVTDYITDSAVAVVVQIGGALLRFQLLHNGAVGVLRCQQALMRSAQPHDRIFVGESSITLQDKHPNGWLGGGWNAFDPMQLRALIGAELTHGLSDRQLVVLSLGALGSAVEPNQLSYWLTDEEHASEHPLRDAKSFLLGHPEDDIASDVDDPDYDPDQNVDRDVAN